MLRGFPGLGYPCWNQSSETVVLPERFLNAGLRLIWSFRAALCNNSGMFTVALAFLNFILIWFDCPGILIPTKPGPSRGIQRNNLLRNTMRGKLLRKQGLIVQKLGICKSERFFIKEGVKKKPVQKPDGLCYAEISCDNRFRRLFVTSVLSFGKR